MNREENFFKGRYGLDSLSIFCILICIVLDLIEFIHPSGSFQYLGILGLLLLILCFLRAISRKKESRMRENEAFLSILSPLTNGMDRRAEEREQKKVFRFFNCPACKQRIRVPKGKGRIEITCPSCATKFIKKT